MNKHCIGFLTHKFDTEIKARFDKLVEECEGTYDVLIVAEKGCHIPETYLERTHSFDFAQVKQRAKTIIGEHVYPGNHHLRNLDFFDAFPHYDFYWGVEYDVIYNGDWKTFFSSLDTDSSDLLGTHLRPVDGTPGWHWFDTFRTGTDIVSPNETIVGFFPIWRMNRRAMLALRDRVKAGWEGHFEILIPTAARWAGLTIADIGGLSAWTPFQRRQRHYLADSKVGSLSTMRHLPLFLQTPRIPGLLYHPCKPVPLTGADVRRTVGHLSVELRRWPFRFTRFYLKTLYRLLRRH